MLIAEELNGLLMGATALHAGFQITVTVLVYPALVATPRKRWTVVHARHSRSIVPIVVLVYAVAVATAALVVAQARTPPALLSVVLTGAALVITATAAAPLHGRLHTADPHLLRRLVLVDRVRCLCAVAAAGAALATLVG